MDLNWLIFPAIVLVAYVMYCYAMYRHGHMRWRDILTLRLAPVPPPERQPDRGGPAPARSN